MTLKDAIKENVETVTRLLEERLLREAGLFEATEDDIEFELTFEMSPEDMVDYLNRRIAYLSSLEAAKDRLEFCYEYNDR
ncbi:MAG: hypothetical protein N2318_10830 [Meiothermus sp.]|nr:hypothetical protein [Meiothermus sp.]